ncbi:unnamed protein product [Mytilus coruscus]|uniref:Uncharacterized protein n=1 Tax=Mytilus coruscus TaxID=42192 RepID=A0A6J8D6N4_MYTCO|nr:unnamed protein product [Mytilus coruscus]
MSNNLSSCPTVCVYQCPYVYQVYRHGYQSVYMSTKLCLHVQQSVDIAIVYVYQYVYVQSLSICLSVGLYVAVSSCPTVCRHDYQSVYMSTKLCLHVQQSVDIVTNRSICLPSCVYISNSLSTWQDMQSGHGYIVYMSTKLCLHVQQSVDMATSRSICLPSCVYMSNSLSTWLSVGLYVYQAVSTCPTVCRHGYQSVYMSTKLCLHVHQSVDSLGRHGYQVGLHVQQSVDMAISQSICLPSCVYMSNSLSTWLSVGLYVYQAVSSCPTVYRHGYQSVYIDQAVSSCPTVCRHGYQSVYMSKLCLHVQQSVDMAISRSICLPSCVYMSNSLSTWLSVERTQALAVDGYPHTPEHFAETLVTDACLEVVKVKEMLLLSLTRIQIPKIKQSNLSAVLPRTKKSEVKSVS